MAAIETGPLVLIDDLPTKTRMLMCSQTQPNALKLTRGQFFVQQANNLKHRAKVTTELFR